MVAWLWSFIDWFWWMIDWLWWMITWSWWMIAWSWWMVSGWCISAIVTRCWEGRKQSMVSLKIRMWFRVWLQH